MSPVLALPADLARDLAAELGRAGLAEPGAPQAAEAARTDAPAPADAWRLLTASPRDLLTLVARGAADVGLVGREEVLERSPAVGELAHLPLRRRRLEFAWSDAAAAPRARRRGRVRVATRFPHVATEWLASQGFEADALVLDDPAAADVSPRLADASLRLVADDAGASDERRADGVDATLVAACGVSVVASHAARVLYGAAVAELLERLRAATRGET